MNTKQLRQKILDLAIRGKLVPQDPNDEPASVLLERIKAEKEQLIKEGKIKRGKKSSSASDKPHYPFDLPKGWTWCKVGDFAFVTKLAGFEYTSHIADNLCDNGIPLFKGKNVQGGEIIYEFESFIPESVSDDLPRSQVNRKCLLTPYVGSIGNIGIHSKKGKFHLGSNVGKIEILNEAIKEEYIRYFFMSSYGYKELTKHKKATAQESISIEAIRDAFVPIPPIRELKQILYTLDYWLSFVSSIENSIEDIGQLCSIIKSKCLELAISGKFVPQDPADEPAEELLRRINPAAVPADKSHYDLPDSYCVVTLKDICKIISARPFQIAQKQIQSKGKYPVVSQSANFIEGYTDSGCAYKIKTPIILFGDHTRNVKFIDFDFVVGADGTKLLLPLVLPQYVYLSTIYASNTIQNRGYSRHFSYLCKVSIPLPPLNEQKRIVAKVDELFAVIDQIQQSLE